METKNPIRVKLFWLKVNKAGIDDCWIWSGAKDGKYGNFTVAPRKTAKAHRFSFKLAFGWIKNHPYQVNHKCRNTLCVNPKHLILLHGITNNEESNSASAINKRKKYCKYGHKFTDDNIIRFKDGHRRCKICIESKNSAS